MGAILVLTGIAVLAFTMSSASAGSSPARHPIVRRPGGVPTPGGVTNYCDLIQNATLRENCKRLVGGADANAVARYMIAAAGKAACVAISGPVAPLCDSALSWLAGLLDSFGSALVDPRWLTEELALYVCERRYRINASDTNQLSLANGRMIAWQNRVFNLFGKPPCDNGGLCTSRIKDLVIVVGGGTSRAAQAKFVKEFMVRWASWQATGHCPFCYTKV